MSARSPEVTWHAAAARERRIGALGRRGATVWFTGLPASGKSTIASAVEELLLSLGRPAYVVDGDNLRHGLCGDLGFSRADREENVRRAAHLAHLLADAGVVALVSLVSPYAADRALARAIHTSDDVPFIEVYVSTSLETCERRDPKRLYARARAGCLPGLTGVDDPYEPPSDPDLTITAEQSVEDAAAAVFDALSSV